MKSIIDYINESEADGKGGHYEDFIDPDTGEICTLWIDDIEAAKEQEKARLAREEEDRKYNEIIAKEKEIRKQLDPLEDQMYDLEGELKDLKREYRDLQIDHEEEVGALYADGKFEEGEKLAQEYGVKFNKLEKQIKTIKNKISKLEPKISKLQSQNGLCGVNKKYVN
jgi:chromosome segregation ATPase